MTARTRRAKDIDAEVLVLDLEIDLFRLGKHGDGGSRGVNASLTLGDGNTLHAVHARFPAHCSVGAFTLDLEDCLLDSAERSVGLRDDLDAPAAALGEARVHPVKVGGENRGFVAAGASADFHDCRTIIERIVRNQRRLYALL